VIQKARKLWRLVGQGGPQPIFFYALYSAGMHDLSRIGSMARYVGNRARLGGATILMESDLIGDEAKGRLLTGLYEGPERELALRYFPRDVPVIELGASIGAVACLVNRVLAFPRQHVVVEAHPGLIPLLERNRAVNGCAFEVVHAAIGYDGEFLDLYPNSGSLAASAHRRGGESLRVPTTSLSDLVTRVGFDRFNLICDIEGSEIDLVDHEADLLARRVDWIVMELHPSISGAHNVERLLARLDAVGFELVEQDYGAYCFHHTALSATLSGTSAADR
jgi:FkbM family methyltransferase